MSELIIPAPQELTELLRRTREFTESRIYPVEAKLSKGDAESQQLNAKLQEEAKVAGLWALGLPVEMGGGGLSMKSLFFVQEEQGRSEFGNAIFGSSTRQDVLSLATYGSPALKNRYLQSLVSSGQVPALSMTEPGTSGSDPSGLSAHARMDGAEWVINGHKWFITGADVAPYHTVMCRTGSNPTGRDAFSLLVVPQGTPGVQLVREMELMGLRRGHWEVRYENVRVPADYIVGGIGNAGVVAQARLAPGRLLHAARWIGQARRAFELMKARLNERKAFGGLLRDKQLMQQHVFDSAAEIEMCHLLGLATAELLDQGDKARVPVGMLKVVASRMQQAVIDRAVQVFGSEAFIEESPLSVLYRTARLGRIYDGPDEVHIENVVGRLL